MSRTILDTFAPKHRRAQVTAREMKSVTINVEAEKVIAVYAFGTSTGGVFTPQTGEDEHYTVNVSNIQSAFDAFVNAVFAEVNTAYPET